MESGFKDKLSSILVEALNLQNNTKIHRLDDPPTGMPRYSIGNEAFFSVTQILDDGKFAKVDPIRLLHAQILGSVVHLQIENYLLGRQLHFNIEETLDQKQLKLFNFLSPASKEVWQSYNFEVRPPDDSLEEIVLINRIKEAYNQFLDYAANNTIEVVFAEKVVWNPDYLYAGTVDLLCLLNNKLTIIDHKTSRYVKDSAGADDSYTGQLSAYLTALRYMGNGQLESNLNILHLNPLADKPKLITRKFNFEVFLQSLARFSMDTSIAGFTQSNLTNEPSDNIRYKKFDCPDKNCSIQSTFPFPKDPTHFESNSIRRVAKVDFHEDSSHFAIFHASIPDYKIERKFTYELK